MYGTQLKYRTNGNLPLQRYHSPQSLWDLNAKAIACFKLVIQINQNEPSSILHILYYIIIADMPN